MPAALQSLLAEHRAILTAADRMLDGLTRTPRIGMDELSRFRAEHAALLRTHLQAEEEQLYRRIAALAPADRPPATAAVARETRELHGRYSDHVRTWHSRSIEKDWAGYTAATAELIRCLRLLIAREEAELYRPLLALTGRRAAA